MARDVVDDRLIGALHVRALTRAGLHHDAQAVHAVVQTGTIAALLDGHYGGNIRLDELLEHGDLGIGTVEHLDGELVVIDGEAWVVHGDGRVDAVPASTPTPFAVVCNFAPASTRLLDGPLDFDALTAALDALAPPDDPVVAVRVDGRFRDLRLRSVHAQHEPYPPLRQVVADQTEWTLAAGGDPSRAGSVVGFRFPDATSGIEVAGYHLHFIADDRTAGGHVLELVLDEGVARVDGAHELHVEVPAGLALGEPGALAGEIAAVEGDHRSGARDGS
jgi:acetolactate decarboxylase